MNRLLSLFASPLLVVIVSTSALGQGSDSCTSPTLVSGGTSFPFNNATATQGAEGQSNTCTTFGGLAFNHDVWFTWMAPATGPFTLSTCGGTTVDTRIAVFSGSLCPTATALACNDDACGVQSMATFSAIAGNAYVFQIGTFPSASGGTGMFTILPGGASCNISTGPDVIVGDMQDMSNHPASGGVDAITLGTTSCNIGTQVVQWQSNNNLHPVIGATLYRYRVVAGSGRFEEIGMSWLKHGFVAEAGSLCCLCQGVSGSSLGTGCSDPYGASLNGSQGGLGPRWQVNAHTGVFAYPHANPGWSGNTARRLEFETADIDTSAGVRYIGECTYVTQDDAAAGNQNNNSSWRPLTASGTSEVVFAYSGAIRRATLAIRAWPEYESGVTLTDLQVPDDGHFVVGSKATSLGGGMWHYEYAVLNQNSDRNGGTFSVPLPAGTTVVNAGFHDVSYRNGDGPGNVNFAGTDWTPVIGPSSIAWACETQAQNASANAIRWSSTYNFRFDANVAPGTGNVVLGLWKSGTPGEMNATAQVPAGSSVPISAFCVGDGSGGACPCSNFSASGSGSGCGNTLGVGALLGSSGTPSITADTFVLAGSNMPGTASVLYFQGTVAVNSSLGAPFGDGLRCVGGTVARLGPETNVLGNSQYPGVGDLSVSVQGASAVGDVRFYQCWYRNAGSFCTSATFNFTNGLQLTWLP